MMAVDPDLQAKGAAAYGGSDLPSLPLPDGDIIYSMISGDVLVSLTRLGIHPLTLARLLPIMTAMGSVSGTGYFDPADSGEMWIAFAEQNDTVFWHPSTDRICTLQRRAFALNEDHIVNAATYCFEANLNVFATCSDWLRADCDGIVVLDWSRAFDRLRDAPRIALAERLLPVYRRSMQPRRLPSLSIIPAKERLAA